MEKGRVFLAVSMVADKKSRNGNEAVSKRKQKLLGGNYSSTAQGGEKVRTHLSWSVGWSIDRFEMQEWRCARTTFGRFVGRLFRVVVAAF